MAERPTSIETQDLPPGHVELHDKVYKTVALRLKEFWENRDKQTWSIKTKCLEVTDERVLFKALILYQNNIMATGHAEETRLGNINAVAALENAETSAIGRALAAFGYAGSVIEFASADEMRRALWKQELLEEGKLSTQKVKKYAEGLRTHADNNDSLGCLELWEELTQPQQIFLWSKLRSYERSQIKALISEAKEIREKAEQTLGE